MDEFTGGFALVWERDECDGTWYTTVIPTWTFDPARHRRFHE